MNGTSPGYFCLVIQQDYTHSLSICDVLRRGASDAFEQLALLEFNELLVTTQTKLALVCD